jgi:hypothetical protein
MRPTDKARKQDMARGQSDRSILYVSLELSRSTWLVTFVSGLTMIKAFGMPGASQ